MWKPFALFLPCHLLTKTENRGGDCIRAVPAHGAVARMKWGEGEEAAAISCHLFLIFAFVKDKVLIDERTKVSKRDCRRGILLS